MKNAKAKIIEKLIEKMESEGAPFWQNPFLLKSVLPYNAETGRDYNGINLFSLSAESVAGDGSFLTFLQGKRAKLNLKKGSKGSLICFFRDKTEDEKLRDLKAAKEGATPRPPFLLLEKYVFPVQFFEGDKSKLKIKKMTSEGDSQQETIEKKLLPYISFLRGGVKNKNQRQAFYSVASDTVNMPNFENLAKGRYYHTLFHELIHSTGAKERLNRNFSSEENKSKSDRGREELIAEIGAVFLSIKLNVKIDFDNSGDYCKSWLKFLKENKRDIPNIISSAEKASDYILKK